MSTLAECIVYIIDEPSMRERDMNGVRKRVAITFSNRQFRNNIEHSGDRNWLQIDVGFAFRMIQKYYYSNTLAKINKYFLGFFQEKELVGVVTLGWGTRPLHTIQRIFRVWI